MAGAAPEKKLSREALIFRHLKHQHPQGIPASAWDIADKASGCPMGRAGEGFIEWLGTRAAATYVEELHNAAHQVGELSHSVEETGEEPENAN